MGELSVAQLRHLLDHVDPTELPDVPGAVFTRLGLYCQQLVERWAGVKPFRARCARCWPHLLFVDEHAFKTHHHLAMQGHCPECLRFDPWRQWLAVERRARREHP